jgi:hypothetical protein
MLGLHICACQNAANHLLHLFHHLVMQNKKNNLNRLLLGPVL